MTVLALDGEQRRAVEAVRGPLVVYAGPGTGKTRVVTERIANTVARRVVSATSVVAVTFTDKAATELLARLRRRGVPVGEPGGVRAATFHSAALRQVGYFWPRVTGSAAPEVLSSKLPVLIPCIQRLGGALTATAADLATEVEWVKAHGAALASGAGRSAPAERRLPGHLATVLVDGPAPRWVLDREAYRAALCTHEGPWPRGGDRELVASLFAELFDAYEAAKSAAGTIDFEDMLAACTALVNVEEVGDAVRSRYTHFTVDEFQDVNRLQWDLLTAWTSGHEDLCVVGDENQAIYGFAGASACYLDAFRARHPDATVVRLRRNYRSTQPVLDLAAAALSRLGSPGGAGVPPARRRPLAVVRGEGPSPILVECQDAQDERDRVVTRCRTLNRAGVAWQEMAVLYRMNAQSEAWEEAFAAADIPFVVRGEQPFFTRRHVTQALAVLVAAERNREGVPVDDPRAALDGALPASPRLDRLVPRILRSRMSWSEAEPAGGLARERWSDLAVLVELARELFEARPDATLGDFLADLRARAALGRAPDGGGLNLLTLHRAKGLEFDAVFVVSVEEGRIPSRLAVARDERLGLHVRDPRSAVAEESRLLYVGLTRARTHLHVSWVGGGGKRRSRFLPGLDARAAPRSTGAEAAPSLTARGPFESGARTRRTAQ